MLWSHVARLAAVLAVLCLAACAAREQDPAAEATQAAALAAAAFRAEGSPRLTLITVINNRSGSGGHTALMVSGSQRVIFDPAGSYRPDYVTVGDDVIYGITDAQFRFYRSAHARTTFHVVTQEIEVSADVAEQALALVAAEGRVASAFCARATSQILARLQGFEDTRVTFFPKALMEDFADRTGVVTDRYYENDAGDVVDGIRADAFLQ